MRPARGVRERGSVDWGAWPGRLYEMESRLGCLTWETMRGRVGWGTWPRGTQFERESRVGAPDPGDSMRGRVDKGAWPWGLSVRGRFG